ncbi:MAG: glycosyltransferase [Acidobacteria bacterium]|nr:MAG: glycosyltransferase [Acidobacteriota bacterium]PYS16457.1 MAG: glycosyltransferase [Acidobacteriota bacterium]
MIAFHYPPFSGGSGVHRTLKFTKYLPEFGWQPLVLTANRQAYSHSANGHSEVPDGVETIRAFALDAKRHLSFRGKYLQCLALPDQWISWWPSAVVEGLSLIRKHRPDVIWSTYPIATAHLIGLTLNRLSSIPWIADFRDPMTDTDPQSGQEYPLDARIRRANARIERWTMNHCTRAVVTTPGTLSIYVNRFPAVSENRWKLIPNGYDEDDFLAAEQHVCSRARNGKPATFVHSGLLYPHARDPKMFFAALAGLRRAGVISPSRVKIVLRATGYDDFYRPQVQDLGLADMVFFEPAVSHREALIEMLNAHGLLVLQASSCNMQIPAKLYECLRARRPIFAMTDPAGDTAAVLRSEGMKFIVPLDCKQTIADNFVRFLSAAEGWHHTSSSEDRHSRKARTRDLVELLDSVSAA